MTCLEDLMNNYGLGCSGFMGAELGRFVSRVL